jgi:assimilatory nitrate reductase catalytic subunit
LLEKPAFIQGIFEFEGAGLERPVSFTSPATYQTPADKRAQTIYVRAGNAAPEMICLVLKRNGRPMRYFPVGAKSSIHVALAVLEDLSPGSAIEVQAAAQAGLRATVVLDIGFMEIA